MTPVIDAAHAVESRMAKNEYYKDVFFAFRGPGPYECVLCGDQVFARWDYDVLIEGRDARALAIHHADHNKLNSHPNNLLPMHQGCHMIHHRQERPIVRGGESFTREWRDSLARAQTRVMGSMTPDEKTAWMKKVRAGHKTVDKTPSFCDNCGAGPFKGPQGLGIHLGRDGCENKSRKWNILQERGESCERCGKGPFVGRRGVLRHQATSRCVS